MDFNNRPSTSFATLSNTERLQLSILHGTKAICKTTEETFKQKVTFSNDAISLLSTLVWKKLEEMGLDLEYFAKHAKYIKTTKKTVIRPRDVLLLARRNSSLTDHLNGLVEIQQNRKKKPNDGVTEPQAGDAVNVEVESNVESNDVPQKSDKDCSRFHPLSDDEFNDVLMGMEDFTD